MRHSKSKPVRLIAGGLILATVVVSGYLFFSRPFNLIVEIDSSEHVTIDTPLVYQDEAIGKVVSVKSMENNFQHLKIVVPDAHRNKLKDGVLITVKPNWLRKLTPQLLADYDQNPDALSPLKSGSKIHAIGFSKWIVRTKYDDLRDAARGKMDAVKDAVAKAKEVLTSEEARQLYSDVEDLFREIETLSKEEYKTFMEEKWPEIKRQLEAMADVFEKDGHEDIANDIRLISLSIEKNENQTM